MEVVLIGPVMVATLLLLGALVGLLPLVLGRHYGRPNLGKLGMRCCTFSGLLPGLPILVAVGFIIAIFSRETDIGRPGQSAAPVPVMAAPAPRPMQGNTLYVMALSGPLRGQSYPLGPDGLWFGCDPSCAVRFPTGTAGVSRRHCCIRWQQGVPVLLDLGSTYGTFMGDGRKLPPSSPAQLAAGSRFYLGDPNCLFQITLP